MKALADKSAPVVKPGPDEEILILIELESPRPAPVEPAAPEPEPVLERANHGRPRIPGPRASAIRAERDDARGRAVRHERDDDEGVFRPPEEIRAPHAPTVEDLGFGPGPQVEGSDDRVILVVCEVLAVGRPEPVVGPEIGEVVTRAGCHVDKVDTVPEPREPTTVGRPGNPTEVCGIRAGEDPR